MALTADKLKALWTAGKLIVNNLTTNDATLPLSAAQGIALLAAMLQKSAIQTGTVSITATANGNVSAAVTFATAFAHTPVVFLFLLSNFPLGYSLGQSGVTTAGCNVILGYVGSSPGSRSIRYIAIDLEA